MARGFSLFFIGLIDYLAQPLGLRTGFRLSVCRSGFRHAASRIRRLAFDTSHAAPKPAHQPHQMAQFRITWVLDFRQNALLPVNQLRRRRMQRSAAQRLCNDDQQRRS